MRQPCTELYYEYIKGSIDSLFSETKNGIVGRLPIIILGMPENERGYNNS